MTPTAKLRALLAAERDQELRAYYRLCLEQLERAPRRPPAPHPPRRCWTGALDVLAEVDR